jgi:ribonuclease P protein component
MKKTNILKSNQEFDRIINSIKPLKYKDYIVYIERTKDDSYYFGFSVGTKLGNAVLRNKIRRQMKNILDEKEYVNGFNCVIIARKSILTKTFQERRQVLLEALQKAQIIKENK